MNIIICPVIDRYLKNCKTLMPVYASACWQRKAFLRGSLDYGGVYIRYDATILGDDAVKDFPFLFAHEEGHLHLRHAFRRRLTHIQKECEADIYAISKLGVDGFVEEKRRMNRMCYLAYGTVMRERAAAAKLPNAIRVFESAESDAAHAELKTAFRVSHLEKVLGGLSQHRARYYVECLLAEMR